jgi:Tol biopolymer transport system component
MRTHHGRSIALALMVALAGCAPTPGTSDMGGGTVPADHPTPSPAPRVLRANGEVLSFTGVPFEVPGDLVFVNPETGEERVLVEDLDLVHSARWSADGRWVAYETPAPEGIGLWVVNASQEPRLVATGDYGVFAFQDFHWGWSPTGAELATIRRPRLSNDPQTSTRSTLSAIDPVTGETTDLGRIVGDVTSAPAWSPDGTRIVFGVRRGALYSVDVRSGERSLLVRLPGEDLDSIDEILWSPDGAHIAVMIRLGPGGWRLYVMNADGSNVRVLVDDFETAGVAWSPDGTRLAYADWSGPDRTVRIWVAPMDGSASAEIKSLVASCRYFYKCDLTWAPDWSRIGFKTESGVPEAGQGGDVLSAIDADGQGEAERIDALTYRSWDGGWYSCECT